MGTNPQDYRLSFFTPTTEQARLNRNLVVLLFSIWAVAIFGFQIALKLLEKPTPEKAYTVFETVMPRLADGSATSADYQDLSRSSLAVLGKIFVTDVEKALLNQAVTWSVAAVTDSSIRALLTEKVAGFEAIRTEITDITDPRYVSARNALGLLAAPYAGISGSDPLIRILPLALTSDLLANPAPPALDQLDPLMSKYLIHNQSFLTNFKVLGFPFHYFYTAILLLILFVGLCWLYCIRIDRMNAKLNIAD